MIFECDCHDISSGQGGKDTRYFDPQIAQITQIKD
jgi:hypothetical protein